MKGPGEIPIGDAAAICKRRGCAYVIVFGVREDGKRFHVTSYGKTKALCRLAGSMADQFADAVMAGTVDPPHSDPGDWIGQAADGIRSRWIQWEQEAEQQSTIEQDSRAGEQHLYACISNYLSMMQACHSSDRGEPCRE